MPMDSLLFVVSDEMNIPFGKFLARFNYVGGICVQSGGVHAGTNLCFLFFFLYLAREQLRHL